MIRIRKHKPPSRIRYEKAHPTVSLRLDKELKTRLREKLKKESFADFVKEWLGEREREEKSLKEARDAGYDEGFEEARDKYAVRAPCSICGETMFIHSDEAKEELARVIKSGEWSHTGCIEDKRRSQEKKRKLFK